MGKSNGHGSGTVLELSAQSLLMKISFCFGIVLMTVISSCHRHTVAAAPVTSNASVYVKPIIIIDAHGNIVASPGDLPPTADKTILNTENARGYTPDQTKNLAYRYKYIPPKVLYIPDALTKTTSRGTYYVYRSKFWYWKKANGYFYLDETYYN